MQSIPPGTQAVTTTTAAARPRVIAVMTCFNRKAMTLSCLESLKTAATRADADVHAIVVDDASTDGTAAAVRSTHPWVEVVDGSGALFWNRGMHEGFGRALRRGADFFLWLNDDTQIQPDTLQHLLRQAAELRQRTGRPAIVVGATAERGTGRITYGGRIARSRLRRFSYELVWSASEPVECEAIEGNCVLIPREIAETVGNLDPTFEHAMGDTDYGLRARRAGFGCFVAPGVAGHCSDNSTKGTYFDATLPLRARWKHLTGRKGLPVRSWLHFTGRHGGVLWPMYFLWPYARVLWSGLRGPRPQGGARVAS